MCAQTQQHQSQRNALLDNRTYNKCSGLGADVRHAQSVHGVCQYIRPLSFTTADELKTDTIQ